MHEVQTPSSFFLLFRMLNETAYITVSLEHSDFLYNGADDPNLQL